MTSNIPELYDRIDWKEWMRTVGRQRRRVREFLGLSQERLARLAGVSQGAVSRLEAGRARATPLLVVAKVDAALQRELGALAPDVLSEEIRAWTERGAVGGGEHALGLPVREMRLTGDPSLEELVGVVRSLPERRREVLRAVFRAAVQVLSRQRPDPDWMV